MVYSDLSPGRSAQSVFSSRFSVAKGDFDRPTRCLEASRSGYTHFLVPSALFGNEARAAASSDNTQVCSGIIQLVQ